MARGSSPSWLSFSWPDLSWAWGSISCCPWWLKYMSENITFSQPSNAGGSEVPQNWVGLRMASQQKTNPSRSCPWEGVGGEVTHSGESRISQRRGRQPQRWEQQPIILVNFPQKLHEIEKKLTPVPSWISQWPTYCDYAIQIWSSSCSPHRTWRPKCVFSSTTQQFDN